jgi:hypothetical protein
LDRDGHGARDCMLGVRESGCPVPASGVDAGIASPSASAWLVPAGEAEEVV